MSTPWALLHGEVPLPKAARVPDVSAIEAEHEAWTLECERLMRGQKYNAERKARLAA